MTSNRNPWIAYVGPFRFPWGQAGSRRVYGNSTSLLSAGYEVRVASGEPVSRPEILTYDKCSGATLSYCGTDELKIEHPRYRRVIQHLLLIGKETTTWLDQQDSRPELVITYGGLATYSLHLLRWCRANSVPLVADVVEWYDPSQMPGGRFGPLYLSAAFTISKILPKFDGAIVISKYLESSFIYSLPVVRVPPTVEAVASTFVEPNVNELRLIYAGVPGKKDLLGEIIEAVVGAASLGAKITLTIIGVTQAQLAHEYGMFATHHAIRPLGRIPQEHVRGELALADFSIILRQQARFTQAGFPTKFVESMAAGVPVIANLTSDLGDYLHHMGNGLIVDGFTTRDLLVTLRQALNLSIEQRRMLKQQALQTAERCFLSQCYASPLSSFVDTVVTSYARKSSAY